MGGSGLLYLPISSTPRQKCDKTKGLPVQENHPNCSKVVQHALVLGSGSYVKPKTTVPAQSASSTFQLDSTQESVKHKSQCLAPTASAIKERGFS